MPKTYYTAPSNRAEIVSEFINRYFIKEQSWQNNRRLRIKRPKPQHSREKSAPGAVRSDNQFSTSIPNPRKREACALATAGFRSVSATKKKSSRKILQTPGLIVPTDNAMPDREQSIEFDLLVKNSGSLDLPPEVAGMLRPGKRFRVRMTSSSLAAVLRRRSISYDMIGKMAELQREPEGNILRFLLSEGILKTDRSFRRAIGKFRKRKS
jgi:hypothetical protein